MNLEDEDTKDLLLKLLETRAENRISAESALNHSFFQEEESWDKKYFKF
jgi:serine/threonine protein kinase